jgi:hypothetical protein
MNKNIIFAASILLFCIACKHKNKGNKEDSAFFPVISFLKSQVSQIDTSSYDFLKVETIDSLADSSHIRREELKGLAKDFLETPDISEKIFKNKYKEDRLYDESLNKVILTYTPIDSDMQVLREEVIITPSGPNGDEVKSIIIEKIQDEKDSTILKRLLWQVNESFQVVTTVQKPNHDDVTHTLQVIWNKKQE